MKSVNAATLRYLSSRFLRYVLLLVIAAPLLYATNRVEHESTLKHGSKVKRESSIKRELTLVRDSQSAAVVILSAAPSAQETLAAEELRAYLGKMSGADVPLAAAPIKDRVAIRILTYDAALRAGWRGRRPAPEGFTLDVTGDALWIVGGDARGSLNGVYEVLETLGVRWFMPGELGENVPAMRTIKLPLMRRTVAPGYTAIAGLIWAGSPGAEDWERRRRAQTGSRTAFFGHNWENIIAATPENKRAHPDWFALYKGERINQLCSTHPDVIRITIEKARLFFKENPEALVFSISPNDGEHFCECDRCRALDKAYGVTDGSHTDRFVHYANAVLKELNKTHPGKQVGILAYVSHTRPPHSAVPDPNYATLICHTPWEFCHVHALDDPACKLNRRFIEYVKGWTKVSRNVAVYDYYGHFYVFAPFPITRNIGRDIPFLYSLGVRRFMSETQQHWATQGINFYLAAKLLWNPTLNPRALLDEYYRGFYGKSAPAMRRFWERFEQAMQETAAVVAAATGDGGYTWLKMYTPALIAAADRDLTQAEQLAATDTDKVRRRVALIRKGFRFTQAWTQMRDFAARKDIPRMRRAGAEAIKRLEETAGTEPQAIWIELAKSQTEAMMNELEKEITAGAR